MKCAILGFGTVGSGAAELLLRHKDRIQNQVGEPLELAYILVRHDYPGSEFAPYFVTDPQVIWNDPSVDIVAEVIGGVGAALDYTRAALSAGKSVVSSNKELVATYGAELAALAEKNGVSYLYEGSVGGGIPLIAPVSLCTPGITVDGVAGILNGTTNYILTAMETSGSSFADALADAQALGYAEADPTADVEGIDAARKIAILADLVFGCAVAPSAVRAKGISSVGAEDFALAGQLGYTVKLIARAVRRGDKAFVFVEPHAVAKRQLLAGVSGVMNACAISAPEVGQLMFYGPGAGKLPTGSAVVADMVRAAERKGGKPFPSLLGGPVLQPEDAAELPSVWYVRAADAPELIQMAFPGVTCCAGKGFTAFVTPEEQPLTEAALAEKLKTLHPAAVFRRLEL